MTTRPLDHDQVDTLIENELRDLRAETRGVDLWAPVGIPPLLQNGDYARGELRQAHTLTESELDRLVNVRMLRVSQLATSRTAPVHYRILLDHLDRTIEGVDLDRALLHVKALAGLEHVHVRRLPAHMRPMSGLSGLSLHRDHTVTVMGPQGPMPPLEGELAARARFEDLWKTSQPYG